MHPLLATARRLELNLARYRTSIRARPRRLIRPRDATRIPVQPGYNPDVSKLAMHLPAHKFRRNGGNRDADAALPNIMKTDRRRPPH